MLEKSIEEANVLPRAMLKQRKVHPGNIFLLLSKNTRPICVKQDLYPGACESCFPSAALQDVH